MKKILILLLSAIFVSCAVAQQTDVKKQKKYQSYLVIGNKTADIDIVEANGVPLKYRTWGPNEERKFSVRAYATISREKWTTVK